MPWFTSRNRIKSAANTAKAITALFFDATFEPLAESLAESVAESLAEGPCAASPDDGIVAEVSAAFRTGTIISMHDPIRVSTPNMTLSSGSTRFPGQQDKGPADALLPDKSGAAVIPRPVHSQNIDSVPACVVQDHADQCNAPQAVKQRKAVVFVLFHYSNLEKLLRYPPPQHYIPDIYSRFFAAMQQVFMYF